MADFARQEQWEKSDFQNLKTFKGPNAELLFGELSLNLNSLKN